MPQQIKMIISSRPSSQPIQHKPVSVNRITPRNTGTIRVGMGNMNTIFNTRNPSCG